MPRRIAVCCHSPSASRLSSSRESVPTPRHQPTEAARIGFSRNIECLAAGADCWLRAHPERPTRRSSHDDDHPDRPGPDDRPGPCSPGSAPGSADLVPDSAGPGVAAVRAPPGGHCQSPRHRRSPLRPGRPPRPQGATGSHRHDHRLPHHRRRCPLDYLPGTAPPVTGQAPPGQALLRGGLAHRAGRLAHGVVTWTGQESGQRCTVTSTRHRAASRASW